MITPTPSWLTTATPRSGVERTIVRNYLLAALGTAGLLLGATLPASAAATFNVQVVATMSTSITVTSPAGDVTCNPGNAVTGVVACTNTVNATGTIRSTHGGTSTLTVDSIAGGVISGTGGTSIPVSAVKMTCADNSSTGTHGVGVFASAAASTVAGTSCASWPGPNVFTYNVNLTFGIDSSQVDADTYTLSSGWTVLAATT
jgi:hypothetical protein